MTGFQDLEGQLLDAIERRGSPRPHRASAILVVAASTAVVVAVAAFAIVSLGHGKPPVPPARPAVAGAPSPRELSYINAATQAVRQKDPRCRPFAGALRAGATISQATPGAAMLSVLGVLRRPATPADRLPAGVYRNGHLMIARVARGIYVRYIRRARVVAGVSYYIVPAAGLYVPSFSARCNAETITVLRGRLAKSPATVRAMTLTFAQQLLGRQAAVLRGEAVFEFEHGRGSGGGGGGESPQRLAQDGMLGTDGSVLHGIVPSGVATVTLEFRNHRPALTSDVVGNVFVVRTGGAFPTTMIWHSANGQVIRTVTTP